MFQRRARGIDAGPAQRWIAQNTGPAYGIGIAVGLLALLVWPDPGLIALIVIVALTVAYLAAVRRLGEPG